MKTGLMSIDIVIRVLSVVMLLANVFLFMLLRKYIPLLKGPLGSWVMGLTALFMVPLFGVIFVGYHMPEYFPKLVVVAYFYPAMAWQIMVFDVYLLIVLSIPFRIIYRVFRMIRKKPLAHGSEDSEISDKEIRSRRDFLRNGALAIPAFSFIVAGYHIISSHLTIETKTLDVLFPTIPGELDGMTVVHISDLHLGSFIRLDDLSNIVDRINDLSPHMVVFTGDFCDQESLLEPALVELDKIKSPMGTFACLGNHDYYLGVDKVISKFSNSSVRLLRDEFIELDSGLVVAGMDFYFSTPNFGFPMTDCEEHLSKIFDGSGLEEKPVLCLVHNPNAFDGLVSKNVDFVVAGHTHGGQVLAHDSSEHFSTPVKRSFPRFKGYYREENSGMYVTSGVGHWLPYRINCPREIVLLRLNSVV